ncbi:MAG: beta-N-acetylhexosaminidase, partial [Eubacteriales bacterium]|nr:beta-N-acetylhexosaminidase [Eubacteriales bacterium]
DQWYAENKGQGFDVQDIRIGGLKQRLAHCEKMLRDFADGKIEKIDELEEPLLDLHGNGADFRRGPICYQSWRLTSTASVL